VSASWFAEFLMDLGRSEDARIYAKQAQDNEPRWLEAITVAGNIHAFSGNPDLAIAEYEIDPSHGLYNHFLGRAYLAKGHFPKAIAHLRRSNELLGQVPFSTSDLGCALARGGQRAEGENMLAELMRKRETSYAPAFAIAEIHLGLDRENEALYWLERAADERNLGYYFPSFDPIYRAAALPPAISGFDEEGGCQRIVKASG
jgi:tetratricopeptide (TPR) repeat protein